MTTFLCATSDIPDPGSKAFKLKSGRKDLDIFVIHKEGQFHAYINSCPHTGINLEWLEDQFLDKDQAFIQCSTHDALFEIDTGQCIHGPCAGDQLNSVKLAIVEDQIIAEL